MNIMNNTELNEKVQDLEYMILLTENGLKNCEDQTLYEQLFNELCLYKVELAKLYDTAWSE